MFEMHRSEDETGISGTGVVVEGTIFSDGQCVVRWLPEKSPAHCVSIWPNFGSFLTIHVHPHPDNKTEIRFSDGSVMRYNESGQFVEVGPPVKSRRSRAKVKS
jgi:hypothetical protein